jgi:hypothetical protein
VHETHPVSSAPYDILALAQQRQKARADRDWATSDALRDQIAAEGWLVKDTPEGFTLEAKPPYDVHANASALPDRTQMPTEHTAFVGLIVQGWPDDIVTFINSVLTHTDLPIIALDLGNVDGAGDAVHTLATEHPARIEAFHLPGPIGWSEATMALLRLNPAPIHIVVDPSSVLDGDAFTPLIRALDDTSVVAAGWRGANVDVADGWRNVVDAVGEVDVLLSYLFAVRRDAAIAAPPHPKARFYRNADLEWSLALREAGGRLVVPTTDLPVHQERHRGYHDSDPQMRDKESRKTYDRLLQRFRGKDHLLAPRSATDTAAP